VGQHSWTRSTKSLALGGLLLALGMLTVSLWLHGTRGAEIANVLALPASVVGVVISASGLSLRPRIYLPADLDSEVRSLARLVGIREARVLQLLLSDAGDADPADLHFKELVAPSVGFRNGDQEGSLRSIGQFYRSLGSGRLVVLGAAGAGKTVLITKLLLDLVSVAAAESKTCAGKIELADFSR
jgi:hypothetical protein